MALKLFSRKTVAPAPPPPLRRNVPRPLSNDPVDLAREKLLQMAEALRFGAIVRDREQWPHTPEFDQLLRSATQALDERFALVPEGFAALPLTVAAGPGDREEDFQVEPFLLARCCVTNAEFDKFVQAGVYEDLTLWPQEVWPHIIDFRDQSGQFGPRFWKDGRFDPKLADHPVVGISVYEADAYARWAGYRLPTEAEWQMAASWRIRSAAQVQRRYPWGDALDVSRCNIWASGMAATTPVNSYPEGAAPNGVLNLVGNVWEWTASRFEVRDAEGRQVVGDMTLTSIRGGAYDTYFPSQATSQFRTGLAGLLRVHNVGFRCAMNLGPQD